MFRSIFFPRFRFSRAAVFLMCGAGLTLSTDADLITWANDLHDATGAPQGALLSDNEGYWGESLLTGATYHYENEPDNPADRLVNQEESPFGRRLLDGRIAGDWNMPVGRSRGPLVVVFDFKRPCAFSEVTLFSTRSPVLGVTIESADEAEGPWQQVHHQALEEAAEEALKRVRWQAPVTGRFLRLSVEAAGITWLEEVLVWGQGEVSDRYPEQIAPTYRFETPSGAWESIPGVTATRFDEERFRAWQGSLGRQAALPALWAVAGEPSPSAPVLPGSKERSAEPALQMARNETESFYVTLTNTSLEKNRIVSLQEVVWSPDEAQADASGIRTVLRVGGALPVTPPKQRLSAEQRLRLHESKGPGEEAGYSEVVKVLPFFAAGDALGRSLMKRYLTNGLQIVGFPQLSLPPAGSAVFMVQVTTDQAAPGRYRGKLVAVADDGTKIALGLRLRVADLELPDLNLWVRSWGNGTRQFPFESQRRREYDVQFNRALGVSVWQGFPTEGSKAQLFGALGPTSYRIQGLPSRLVHRGHGSRMQVEDLTDEDRQEVVAYVQALVQEAETLGLSYDQWWVELWDEPQEGNAALFGTLARWIRQTDPKIRIYMNPLFWRPGHASPEAVMEHLGSYYNELVDISVPISTLVRDGTLTTRHLWTHPRQVNAFFMHPARRAGRGMAWRAFQLGFNGWAYYCYYAPRGNPWDIRTWSWLNYSYQMVFPGPQGPIPTPLYEVMRDGWEDYRLLAALRERGNESLLQRLLQRHKEGASPADLRQEAMKAF